ncbi:MAG: hypothetical protein P1V51_01795 [Deltaproteobacteria bacterium]|nr:hypothetical protein [Deltaproteobacteria bacterium]
MRYLPLLSRFTDERGGAMVEMAISMIVFVPMILYALLLDDLLRYKLNLQETVISAQWDLTARDYEKGSNHANSVGAANRLLYCDHSAAYNAYSAGTDCDDETHHLALSAHQCWLQGGGSANQVACELTDDSFAADVPMDFLGPSGALIGEIQNGAHGGFFTCKAQLSVINDRISSKFMQQFSQHDILEGDDKGAGGLSEVHHVNNGLQGDAHGVSGGFFQYPPYRTAILTDTWALNDVADQDQENESGNFFDRVDKAYTGSIIYWGYFGGSIAFLAQAWGNELLMPGYGWFFGDNLFEADLAVRHGQLKQRYGVGSGSSSQTPKNNVSEEGQNRKYFVTPWKDGDGDKYENTYKNSDRGKWYMGCKDAESC